MNGMILLLRLLKNSVIVPLYYRKLIYREGFEMKFLSCIFPFKMPKTNSNDINQKYKEYISHGKSRFQIAHCENYYFKYK